MSLNQVLRYVGFAVGSALTATVLASATAPGGSPATGGYTTIAGTGVAVCLLTAVVTGLTGRRPSTAAAREPAATR
jgi:hypothetical protein